MRKKKSRQFGTVIMNGDEYYRTRIRDQDGRRVAIYAILNDTFELWDNNYEQTAVNA